VLTRLFLHPLTRGHDIDAPETTSLRRKIIHHNGFLRKIYEDWYTSISMALPVGTGGVLELGSGAGFLDHYIPDLITSDVLPLPHIDHVIDAHVLPFEQHALRAIVMTNVFHHLAHPRQFLREAARCVRPRGSVVMVEPWNTAWSRFIYSRFHHEPFVPNSSHWHFGASGPLSGANIALPWIIFERDLHEFEMDFPEWRLESVVLTMPFRYLLSGGLSHRQLMPAWTFPGWRWLENQLWPWMSYIAMFARLVLRRTDRTTTT
jgi:SAM-dependent methyltransferase